MTKHKKLFGLFAILFVALFSVGCVFATACGKKNKDEEESEPEHVHEYTKLNYDSEYHWYECVDGAVDESTKEAHKFDNGTVTKAADCGNAGSMTYKCDCGYSYSVTIDATGEHTFDTAVFTWATDYSSATASLVCSVCGTVSADYKDVVATVTSEEDDDGNTIYTATVTLDKEYTDEKTVTAAGETPTPGGDEASLESVSLSASAVHLVVGDSYTLEASALMDDGEAYTGTYTWSNSQSAYVSYITTSVSQDTKSLTITASSRTLTNVTITVTAGEGADAKTATCTVSVSAVPSYDAQDSFSVDFSDSSTYSWISTYTSTEDGTTYLPDGKTYTDGFVSLATSKSGDSSMKLGTNDNGDGYVSLAGYTKSAGRYFKIDLSAYVGQYVTVNATMASASDGSTRYLILDSTANYSAKNDASKDLNSKYAYASSSSKADIQTLSYGATLITAENAVMYLIGDDNIYIYTVSVSIASVTASFSQESYLLEANATSFTAPTLTVTMPDGSDYTGSYTYTSSNTDFATVDATTGAVTLKEGVSGETTITVTLDGGITASYTIAKKAAVEETDPIFGEWTGNIEFDATVLGMDVTLTAYVEITVTGNGFTLTLENLSAGDFWDSMLKLAGLDLSTLGKFTLLEDEDWYKVGETYRVTTTDDADNELTFVATVENGEEGYELHVSFVGTIGLQVTSSWLLELDVDIDDQVLYKVESGSEPVEPEYSIAVEGAVNDELTLTIADGEEGGDDVFGSAKVTLYADNEAVENAVAVFEITTGGEAYVSAENGAITAVAAGTATVTIKFYAAEDTAHETALATVTITVTVTDN